MKKPVVFLDACVWLRGITYPYEASGWVIYLSMIGEIKVITSSPLIEEVKRNLRRKDKPHFLSLIQTVGPEIIDLTDREMFVWANVVPLKDCHVLAGAIKGEVEALLTLDSEHILKQKTKNRFPIPIFNPNDFITWLSTQK